MSVSSLSTPKQKGELYLASSLCDGLEDNNLKQVTTLLKNKDADPNVLMPLFGITPFHLVIGNDSLDFAEEVTKLFLQHGGNPNVKSVDGMTPVHVAAAWGRTKILELLLANGGDPLCLDSDCYSPFHYAFQGEHFDVVSVLSKYCTKEEDENETPKYKRELDKVLVNNGEVLAEYIVSDDSSLNSSFKNSYLNDSNKNNKINESGYTPESSLSNTCLTNNDFITLRKNQRKRLAQEKTEDILKDHETNQPDFKRINTTEEEELHLINEIISKMTSSVASDADLSKNMEVQNYDNECRMSCGTNSPKRMQITMTFNRPLKIGNSKSPKNQNTRRRSSTLQVIKHHNSISTQIKKNQTLINNTKKSSNISEKNLMTRKPAQSVTKKITPRKVEESELINKYLNETIISKSPNLIVNTQNKINKLLETSIFEKKKMSPMFTKVPIKPSVTTPNKIKSPSTPVSRIPKPKKYFITPINLRTVNKIVETPKSTTISNKYKSVSKKIDTNNKSKCTTPLNFTSSKSETSASASKYTNVLNRKFITPLNSTSNKSNTSASASKCAKILNSKCTTPSNSTFSKSKVSASAPSIKIKQTAVKNDDRRKSFKNITMNLNNYMYDDDENDLFKEKSLKTFSSNESRHSPNTYVSNCKKVFGREAEKMFTESELISGIGMLDTGLKSKLDSKLDIDNTNREEVKLSFQESETDLNRGILDAHSNVDSGEENCNLGKESFKNINKSFNVIDSLACEKGSTSDSNESFLSLNKFDDCSNDNKDVDDKEIVYNKEINIESSLSPKSNLVSLKDDSYVSNKRLDPESLLNMEEEYKYEDPEEGVVFLERRLCVSPSCTQSDMSTSFYSCNTMKSEPIPKELFLLDNITLREKLKTFGENPGPITKTTHHLYLKRLHKLESQGKKPIHQNFVANSHREQWVNKERQKELLKSCLLSIDWIQNFSEYEALEQKIFHEFASPNPSRRWREGTSKSSFNYLLLDPRVTQDLPRRTKLDDLTLSEKWQIFLTAIFYVGKGKKSRPYAHLYDAFKIWVSKDQKNVNNEKIQRILDIWNEGKGVVVLHVFHNTIPVEAYTREAAMIEVLGTQKLGNCKVGDYYGVVSTWRSKEKCELGRYLLFKALQIFLLEGERQIFPDNL